MIVILSDLSLDEELLSLLLLKMLSKNPIWRLLLLLLLELLVPKVAGDWDVKANDSTMVELLPSRKKRDVATVLAIDIFIVVHMAVGSPSFNRLIDRLISLGGFYFEQQ